MDWVELMLQNINLLLVVALFIAGWFFGRRNERAHLHELVKQERLLGHILVSNERRYQPQLSPIQPNFVQLSSAQYSHFVMGSVVIAQDYFKMTIAGLLSLFGKNLTTFESLLERARREAVVRLKSQALAMGCNQVYGLRFETTEILGGIEVLAYATAVATVNNPKVPPALPLQTYS